MARRGGLLVLVWVAFLTDLLVGAGLLLSKRQALFATGVAMVLLASIAMASVTLYYYVQQRRGPPSTKPE